MPLIALYLSGNSLEKRGEAFLRYLPILLPSLLFMGYGIFRSDIIAAGIAYLGLLTWLLYQHVTGARYNQLLSGIISKYDAFTQKNDYPAALLRLLHIIFVKMRRFYGQGFFHAPTVKIFLR